MVELTLVLPCCVSALCFDAECEDGGGVVGIFDNSGDVRFYVGVQGDVTMGEEDNLSGNDTRWSPF